MQTFQQSLTRFTADELHAVASDAHAAVDYPAFGAVWRALRARPAKDAGRARVLVDVRLKSLPLPPDDQASIEDAEAYGKATAQVGEALHALATGDESVMRHEGIRLIQELGPEGFTAVRAARREERERAAAPKLKLPITGDPIPGCRLTCVRLLKPRRR